jgi:Flp pilus assembly protein TadG
MVNAFLTPRAIPPRFDETIQQSVRDNRFPRLSQRLGFVAMSSPTVSTSSFHRLLRRFRRNRRASTVVEFALVAPLFFALLFAIVEAALVFFADQVLETMTQDAARMILTGQAQLQNYSQQQFKDKLCPPSGGLLFNCNNVYVDVESYTAFQNVNLNSQIDASGNFINNMQYNPGGPGDIVVVRAFYAWQLLETTLGFNLSNMAVGQRLLVATAAFKNEPY